MRKTLALRCKEDSEAWFRLRSGFKSVITVYVIPFFLIYVAIFFQWFLTGNLTFSFILNSAVLTIALIILTLNWMFYVKAETTRLSRNSCIFLANESAKYLKQGDTTKASLYIETLLLALEDFLNQKLIRMYNKTYALNRIIGVSPRILIKSNIKKFIQTIGNYAELQLKINNLIKGLESNSDAGYVPVQDFLIWLDSKLDKHLVKEGFFDKHPVSKQALLAFLTMIPSLILLINNIFFSSQ